MAKEEENTWIMHGMDWDNPLRIRTWEELISYIDQVGFLPLFRNEVPGFSAEEHVSDLFWWTDDPEQDPWKWREIIARSGRVAYGKFFNRKAGFISLKWFPAFANYRRDGYDFDARWEDELASYRAKKIIDLFETHEELYSYEVKKMAGFGRKEEDGGDKGCAMRNFEGVITELEMQGYIVIRDFRRRRRKSDGVEYGWPISVYTTPERLLGQEAISEGYREEPEKSRERIFARIREEYPEASEEQLLRVLK